MTPDRKPFALSATPAIQAAEGEQKMPTFTGLAYTGAPMRPGGWFEDIIIDLDGVIVPSQQRPVLRAHDHEQIVGHTTAVTVDSSGIKIAGVFSGEQHHVDSVVQPGKNGFPWQLSVGADPIERTYLEPGQEAEVNGRTVTGPVTISRRTELGEISFVALGADGDTSAIINARKGKKMNAFAASLKEVMAELRAASKAAKYTDAEVDEMSAEEARFALKECMASGSSSSSSSSTGSDSDDDDDDDDDDKDSKSSKAKAKKSPPVRLADTKKIMADLRRDMALDMVRTREITAACRRYGAVEATLNVRGKEKKVNLVEHAIEHDWTIDQVKSYLLDHIRAERPSVVPGGLSMVNGSPQITDAVLEAAVFQALGNMRLDDDTFYKKGEGKRRVNAQVQAQTVREWKGRYTDNVQQIAHEQFKGRLGFNQLLTLAARQRGYHGSEMIRDPGTWHEIAANFKHGIQADGASSIDIGNVLANVQNKFMLQGYLFTEQEFLEIVGTVPVKDFKPTKSTALFGDFQFEELGPDGQIKHAKLQDQAFANQADMFARMITIPLATIINDDLGQLGQIPTLLGRGWGLKLNDLVWTLFLNPGKDDGGSTNFFAAVHTLSGGAVGNSNYNSGAGSTLTSAGLQALKVLIDKQVDPSGKPLGASAEILLYPPELDVAAIELMNAQFLVMAGLASTSAATKQPNTNIWQGRFNPVMSRYLSDSNYTGYSTTGWYLLMNPSIWPVIQLALWNGNLVPMVQTATQDFQFDTLGISMRGYGGVGVTMQNFRGGAKSAGA